jgi:penicillin-binding protein 1A
MASAYATLAAGGVYSKPMAITKVIHSNGKADTSGIWGKPQRERVIPDWVASTVTQVLEQNMLYGTGRGAHVSNRTDAGKSGTTDNYADAWFNGYTPRLQAAVWIGYPQAEIPMLNVHGIAVSGPTFPAQIWHLFMDTAIGHRPDVPFLPAQTKPQWTSWQGQYQFSGSYGIAGTAGATGAMTTGRSTRPAHTTTAAPATTAAATTTAPQLPPATTETQPPVPPPTGATGTQP